jgi:hypothetical protein
MNKGFKFLNFLTTGMFSGAGWTAIAICGYILLSYGYYFLYFSHEKPAITDIVFGIDRFLSFILLLVAGIVINGITGLCLGIILAFISYTIFPRAHEVERVYRGSIFWVTMFAILIMGSLVWPSVLCAIVGMVYVEVIACMMI